MRTQKIYSLDTTVTEEFENNCKFINKKYSRVVENFMKDFNETFKNKRV